MDRLCLVVMPEAVKREVEKEWITAEEEGYEVPFTKHIYVYQPLREAGLVSAELSGFEGENLLLMKELGIN